MKRVPLFLVLSLSVFACMDSATGPGYDAPIPSMVESAISSPNAGASMGVIQAVTGSGHLVSSVQVGWRTFSIHATKASDETVKGSFHWRVHLGKGGSKVSGSVVCFTTEGNQAWLGVLFEKAGGAANIGKWASILVTDNGEGRGSLPDELGIKWRGFPGEGNLPEDFCRDKWTDLELFPIEAGNIQIH